MFRGKLLICILVLAGLLPRLTPGCNRSDPADLPAWVTKTVPATFGFSPESRLQLGGSQGSSPVEAMNLDLIVTPEAEEDLAEAKAWYERQRKGLGERAWVWARLVS